MRLTLTLLLCYVVFMNAAADAQVSCDLEGSFAEFDRRAKNGATLDVVYLGGSLTWGANATDPNRTSWRALTGRYLQERYPDACIRNHDAAIGGTGSYLGLFRLERDVLRHDPELVFLEYTVNDGVTGNSPERAASYETILRTLVSRGIPVEVVLLGVKRLYDPAQPLENAARRAQHLELAAAYGAAVGDTYPHVRRLVQSGQADLDTVYCFEGTHPDDPGYQLFFEAVRDGFEAAVEAGAVCTLPPAPCFPPLFTNVTRRVLTGTHLPAGWQRDRNMRVALWFDGLPSRWQDGVAVCGASDGDTAAPLTVRFEGTLVGLFGEGDDKAADFTATIDGEPVEPRGGGTWDFSTRRFGYSKGQLFMWRILADDLPPGPHTLEIRPVFPLDADTAQLRIESVCFAARAGSP
ncbi:MAG: SGNH/GDSL hydrolase family protein [Lentisphaerae bacterium]|nr:SGNH/GDSL hydrolase family protein [Lentisphaerota bacterium]